jgi:hypothetical protein
MLKLAEYVGLTDAINNHVQLLKSHAPYHVFPREFVG